MASTDIERRENGRSGFIFGMLRELKVAVFIKAGNFSCVNELRRTINIISFLPPSLNLVRHNKYSISQSCIGAIFD